MRNPKTKWKSRGTGERVPRYHFSSRRQADTGESSAVLRMKLVGANVKAAVTGAEELPGKSNYFIGNDPKKWRTNVPTYAKVKYQGVYPGVDLVYYGNQGGQLEYDFVVAPGADPNMITLDVAGRRQMCGMQGRFPTNRGGSPNQQEGGASPAPTNRDERRSRWSRPTAARFVSTSRWSTNPPIK